MGPLPACPGAWLVLDSTVVVRYGLVQAGAEKGCNPKKLGRPSHHPLCAMGALAYPMLHHVRTTALAGTWKRAQPERLRVWLFRLPAKLTTHARKHYVQLQREAPLRRELLQALRRTSTGPPLAHAA